MALDRADKAVKTWVNTLRVQATSEEDALILLSYHASKREGAARVEFETWEQFDAWCDEVLGGAGWTRTTPSLHGLASDRDRMKYAWTFLTYRDEDVDHGDDWNMTRVAAWGVNARGDDGYNF